MSLKRMLVLVIVCLASLVSAFWLRPASADTLAQLRERGTLRVGVGIMGLKPYI